MTRSHGLRWVLVAAMAALSGICWLAACSKGDDGPPVDMRVILEREAGCEHVLEFRIVAEKPFDQTFSGQFEGNRVELEWFYMPPEAEIPLEVQLLTGDATFRYYPSIAKPWGDTAVFTISCEEKVPRPVLTLDLVAFNAIVTIPATCRWFSELRILEEYAINPDTKLPMLRRLLNTSFAADRAQLFWQSPPYDNPVAVLDLHIPERGADGGDLIHRFRFPTQLEWGNRFDFIVSCGETVRDVTMQLKAGGETYDPTPYSAEDGDGDTDGDDPDGDTDGDTDGDEPDGDTDGDDPDGDTDGDGPDGDTDGDEDGDLDTEEETDPGCGTEDPDAYDSIEAETIVLLAESSPANLARIVDTSGQAVEDGDVDDEAEGETEEPEAPYHNPQISGGAYVRLDATEAGGELVFEISVPQTWTYRIQVEYVGGVNTWGEVSLFLDNATTPLPLQGGATKKDLSIPSAGSYEEWPLSLSTYQPVCLSAGTHRLRARVVSTRSQGCTIGVDRIGYLSE